MKNPFKPENNKTDPKKSKIENLKEELEIKIKSVTKKLENANADFKEFEQKQHKKDIEISKERAKVHSDIKIYKKKLTKLQNQLSSI